jgi:hypothetical protein
MHRLTRIRIPHELAGNLSMVLRERMLRLQQQQLAALKVDRVYDDRLSDAISDELWTEKSGELQEQLRRVRAEMERHDGASGKGNVSRPLRPSAGRRRIVRHRS